VEAHTKIIQGMAHAHNGSTSSFSSWLTQNQRADRANTCKLAFYSNGKGSCFEVVHL